MAPPEVSALPDGGTVADLDASGDVVLAAGGFAGVSAAKTGAIPMDNVKAANAKMRIISGSFLCPIRITERFEADLFPQGGKRLRTISSCTGQQSSAR